MNACKTSAKETVSQISQNLRNSGPQFDTKKQQESLPSLRRDFRLLFEGTLAWVHQRE